VKRFIKESIMYDLFTLWLCHKTEEAKLFLAFNLSRLRSAIFRFVLLLSPKLLTIEPESKEILLNKVVEIEPGKKLPGKDSLTSNLFILLLGFVSGNLFPTFCGEYLGKAYIFILISLESFNYFYYSTPFKVSTSSNPDRGWILSTPCGVSSAKKLRRQKLKSQSNPGFVSDVNKLSDTEMNDKTKSSFSKGERMELILNNLSKNRLNQWFSFLSMKKNKPLRSLQNSLKIGFLFGLFVDAFKVGS
jgi:hypothetical protein